jgi:hypothetical protein
VKSRIKRIASLIRLFNILGLKRTILGIYQNRQETFSQKMFEEPKSIRDRSSFVRELANRQKNKFQNYRFLEIGPYMSPILTHEEADYFDVLDTAQLIKRSELESAAHYRVAKVDFVGHEASEQYIPNKYSLIVSSHVVEHQIDYIRHLEQIHKLLIPGGIYVALIPDLRYCFDHFQKPSTIVDLVEANLLKPTNHTLHNFLDDRLLTTHNATLDHWRGNHGDKKIDSLDSIAVSNFYAEHSGASNYIDIHAWKFTPLTFRSLNETLSRLNMIQLKLQHIAATFPGNNEFWVIFEK